MSTCHAMEELVDEMTNALDNEKYTIGICVD